MRGFAPVACFGLLLACSDDDPLEPENQETSAALGGSGGSSSSANGGGARGGAAGSGGASSSGSGGDDDVAAGGGDVAGSAGRGDGGSAGGEPEGVPGETGIFVGVTAAHNRARAALDTNDPLGDLVWSDELALVAQDWSDNLAGRCGTLEHRQPNEYGENIAIRGSSRLIEPFSPEEAVAGWVSEEACWTFGTILGTEICDPQCAADVNSNGCGHYTQVVWRSTRSVGCGYSTCEAQGNTFEVWVCNYDPPGNFIGLEPY